MVAVSTAVRPRRCVRTQGSTALSAMARGLTPVIDPGAPKGPERGATLRGVKILAFALVAAALAAPALAAPFPGVRTPTHNITCAVTPAALHCDITQAAYRARLQKRCIAPPTGLDWHGFELTPTGKERSPAAAASSSWGRCAT